MFSSPVSVPETPLVFSPSRLFSTGDESGGDGLTFRSCPMPCAHGSSTDSADWQVVRRKGKKKSKAVGMSEAFDGGDCNGCAGGCGRINLLKVMEPEAICAVTQGGFEEIELAVDSGATETVIGERMLGSIKASTGRKGVRYETATGDIVGNLGQKDFVAITDDTAMTRSMTAQVAEGVTKGLLSVVKAMDAGNRVVFDSDGSYIVDKQTGDVQERWANAVENMVQKAH